MTQHLHAEHVPGCYRCDLSADEMKSAQAEHLMLSADELVQHMTAEHSLGEELARIMVKDGHLGPLHVKDHEHGYFGPDGIEHAT